LPLAGGPVTTTTRGGSVATAVAYDRASRHDRLTTRAPRTASDRSSATPTTIRAASSTSADEDLEDEQDADQNES